MTPEEFRHLGYRAIDLLAERLGDIRTAAVRQPVPPAQRDQWMHAPLPETGTDAAALVQRVADEVLPYPMGNSSPRFFALVNSPSAPLAWLADLLAAAHNASVAGGDHAATYIEHGVLNWLKAMMGYPAESMGLLASGGSVANLIALAAMRNVKARGDMRAHGFLGEGPPMVVYTSTQGHTCLQKAVEILGIGSAFLRKIPTDADYRMDVAALRAQIAADRAANLRPVCVAASAGTVNSGAIDPFEALADVCAQEDLWFHIDGAYGGFGILAEQTQGLYKGLERADSLAIDPHKWLYVPIECGCVLVRDGQALRDTFSVLPPYLRDDRALPWLSEFGPQQTRGFKALKLWLVIQQIGMQGYRALISRDIALARALQAKIRARADFELVAAGPLSITCFRYAPPGVADAPALNKRLLESVQAEGQAFLTGTELDGAYVLRACIVNFRTTEADLDTLLDVIVQAGQRALAAG
ncbi:MAG: amino acid decarboxylase [Chloroflexi bacterium]|nr:amino acid decarboxylase [Chloroflexota bacterium]